MKCEGLDLFQLPGGYYKVSENSEPPFKTQGYEVINHLVYPIELYGLKCLKDDENGSVWARNPKTWKWQLLVNGNNK